MNRPIENMRTEQTVLAALLQRPDRYLELKAFGPADFVAPEAKVFFFACERHHHEAAARGELRYASTDAIERIARATLRPVPNDPDRSKRNAAGLVSLISLLDTLTTWPAISDHEWLDAKDQFRKQAIDLRLREGLLPIIEKMGRGQTEGLFRDLSDLTLRVNPDINGSDTITLGESAPLALARYRAIKTTGAGKIMTPWPSLNKSTRGGRKGRLWIVAAFTGDGKTMTMVNLIYHAVTHEGQGAAIFVAEQTKEEIEDLLIIRHSHKFKEGGIDGGAYIDGNMTPEDEAVLEETTNDWARSGYGDALSITQVPAGTTVDEVKTICGGLRSRHPIDIIGMDHSLLFSTGRRHEDHRAQAAGTIMETKQLAMNFADKTGAWVILTHQITREGNERAVKRGYYVMADLAATSEAERSADVVLWALRTPELKAINEMVLGTAKDRWGVTIDAGFRAYERFSGAAILPIDAMGP